MRPASCYDRIFATHTVQAPWEPGAIRVIHVTDRDPGWQVGELVLVNGNTGLKLGRYQVIAGYSGRRRSGIFSNACLPPSCEHCGVPIVKVCALMRHE